MRRSRMKHTISVLLQNKPGVLSRVTGLFSGRGFNIESLSVNETLEPSISCLVLVTRGDSGIIEQITKQLNKLVDVIKLNDLTEGAHIERELMLLKIKVSTAKAREEIKHLVEIFRGKIIDVGETNYTVEMTGTADKLDAFINRIQSKEIIEVVRSGVLGIARGYKSLQV